MRTPRNTVGGTVGMVGLLAIFGSGYTTAGAPVQVTCAHPGGVRVLAECSDIRAAQMKLRELKSEGKLSGPVEVLLRKGVHRISAPLRFTPEDSGAKQAPITYRAEVPGTVTISGGAIVSGWRREGNGVWCADVPAVREGELYFRQLFVNGQRRTRARSPNKGFYHTTGLIKKPGYTHRQADGFYYAGDDLTEEIAAYPDTMLIVYQSWLSRQYRIGELRPERKTAIMASRMDIYRSRARFLVENAPVCLDAPGEWHLERQTGVVRYIPLPGEDLRKAAVTVPVTASLLQFKGDPERGAYVEHLHFKGLTLAYADWRPQGHSISGGQARCPTGENADAILESGAVSAIGLRHASFEDCEITRVGAHAITLLQGCAHNVIRQCHLHDLGGGGVYMFWQIPVPGKRPSWTPRGEYDHIVHNVVDNCFIHDMTHVFNGSVGVLTGPCAAYNRITHNEICYGDYTGISIGWGWSARKDLFFQDGNVVEYNHVHHVMNYELDDGGGIYLLSWQKDARVCYNWIHDVRHDSLGHGAKGIYPDSGTSGVLFEGNVVHDVVQGFHGNGGLECIVRNNIFAFNQKAGVIGGSKWWDIQVKHNPNSLLFERNIVVCDEGILMGARSRIERQKSRQNIYWSGPAKLTDELFGDADTKSMTFAAWQAKGHDAGSVIADPLFVDAAKRDLRLRPDSPALKMGFKQTDLSKVGLYGDRDWTSLPQRVKHAPIVSHPGPVEFEWTYEDEVAGAPPTHSGVMCPGKADLQHRIEVTDADAASGKRCLKFVEGKSEGAGFFPFLRHPIGAVSGPIQASLRLKLPAATPAALYVSFRDYNNKGNKYFQTGPKIQLDTKGILTGPEGSDVTLQLPYDTWITLEMAFAAGREAPKTFDLTVSPPGQTPHVYRNVPFLDPGFRYVSRIYIVSTGPSGGTFLIDDVRVSTPK